MIERIIARLDRLAMPADFRERLYSDIRQIREAGQSISQQNGTLYRACGVIRSLVAHEQTADALCRYLTNALTVPVTEAVVRASIRRNRNKPVVISPDEE